MDVPRILHGLALSRTDLQDLVTVHAQEKPAAHIFVRPSPALRDGRERSRSIAVEHALASLGLHYEQEVLPYPVISSVDDRVGVAYIDTASYYVASSHEYLDRLLGAHTPAEKGIAYGYPLTAIEAFTGRRERLEDPLALSRHPLFGERAKFAHFALSRSYWPDELQVGAAWAAAVKRLHPELHSAILTA